MKLDRRLDEDADFPVVSRGTQAGGWQFDLEAVKAYLEPEEEREIVAEDLATPEGGGPGRAHGAPAPRPGAGAAARGQAAPQRGELVEAPS
jgi:hypothetical protein